MTQAASEFAGVERMRSSRSEAGDGGTGFGGAARRDGSVALKERRQLILQGREKDGNKRGGGRGGKEGERERERRRKSGPCVGRGSGRSARGVLARRWVFICTGVVRPTSSLPRCLATGV